MYALCLWCESTKKRPLCSHRSQGQCDSYHIHVAKEVPRTPGELVHVTTSSFFLDP